MNKKYMQKQQGNIIILLVISLAILSIITLNLSQSLSLFSSTITKYKKSNDDIYILRSLGMKFFREHNQHCEFQGDYIEERPQFFTKSQLCQYKENEKIIYYFIENLGLINNIWHKRVNMSYKNTLLSMRLVSVVNNNNIDWGNQYAFSWKIISESIQGIDLTMKRNYRA